MSVSRLVRFSINVAQQRINCYRPGRRNASSNLKKGESEFTFSLEDPIEALAPALAPLTSPRKRISSSRSIDGGSSTATEEPCSVESDSKHKAVVTKPRKPRTKRSVSEPSSPNASDSLPDDGGLETANPEKRKRRSSKKGVIATDDVEEAIKEDRMHDAELAKILESMKKPKKSRAKRSTTDSVHLDALPGSFGEAIAQEPTSSLPSLSPAEQLIEDQLTQALNEQKLPDSPLAKMVYRNWKRFPDCIVLTRVGKFYESYFDAAKHLTSLIDIKLTHKTQRARSLDPRKEGPYMLFPFAGFPVASLDKYLKILVQDLGQTVVLVEENSEENGDGLKTRKVGQVITPGTLLDASWVNPADSRYLLSIAIATEMSAPTLNLWLAYTDVSTGESFSKETTLAKLEDELTRIAPKEIILDSTYRSDFSVEDGIGRDDRSAVSELLSLLRILGIHISFAETYRTPELEGPSTTMPFSDLSLEAQSISLLRHHLIFAMRDNAPDLSKPDRQLESAYMHIDTATLTGLEIRHAIRYGEGAQQSPLSAKGTLLSVIDNSVTHGGHRLLVRTVSAPSTNIAQIEKRQALVQAFLHREDLRVEIQAKLRPLKDVPRLIQRIKHRYGTIDDLWEVGVWIRGIIEVSKRISEDSEIFPVEGEVELDLKDVQVDAERFKRWIGDIKDVSAVCERIESTMRGDIVRAMQSSDPKSAPIPDEGDVEDEQEKVAEEIVFPVGMSETNKKLIRRSHANDFALSQRWWINPTANETLTMLHRRLASTEQQRHALQAKLQEQYLSDPKQVMILFEHEKIGPVVLSSRVADRAKLSKQPGFRKFAHDQYGRYLEYDAWSKLYNTRRTIIEELERAQRAVYAELQEEVKVVAADILSNAKVVDELDLCMSFAETADDWQWVRPKLTDSIDFCVESASHPVVEAALLSTARTFVRNSIDMSQDSHLHIITGPNQGGKSTFLRQAAIIAILAQSGSFVPAYAAQIGIIDQLFSRIGARDDLFRDRSTFMLEMVETAAILRDATKRSLVIMDEIGRGTTLQAGMAIAYATLDYVLRKIGCRTLFATHYHELEDMLRVTTEDGRNVTRDGIEYWCTDVDRTDDGAVSYSYHLKPGINYDSHAILAARMAGMPLDFIEVAGEKLQLLQAEKQREKGLSARSE